MQENRIYFKDNPWPEGHPIDKFEWQAKLIDETIWFDLHLETANYYSERDIDDSGQESDWKSPIVWGNYHRCTMSSHHWHDGGFEICSRKNYSLDYLDGFLANVDTSPEIIKNWDDLAFHIYLLGHDSVACHKIKFIRKERNYFDIDWSGKIALIYGGDDEYKYSFSAQITNINAPKLSL